MTYDLLKLAREINVHEDSLPEFEVYGMWELEEMLDHLSPSDIMNKVYYGDFNPNAPFHRFDGYENIESLFESELYEELEEREEEILSKAEELGLI